MTRSEAVPAGSERGRVATWLVGATARPDSQRTLASVRELCEAQAPSRASHAVGVQSKAKP